MKHITVIEPAPSITCPFCGGDGISRCSNPDHGFIRCIGGEIGRLGCPVCGHDDEHRIYHWDTKLQRHVPETCEYCHGSGLVHQFTEEVMERLAEI